MGTLKFGSEASWPTHWSTKSEEIGGRSPPPLVDRDLELWAEEALDETLEASARVRERPSRSVALHGAGGGGMLRAPALGSAPNGTAAGTEVAPAAAPVGAGRVPEVA